MRKTIAWINAHKNTILENLKSESITVYQFLQQRVEDGNNDLTKDFLFQFVYRNFYRLDNAGLTDTFKTTYFKLMQEQRDKQVVDFEQVLWRLHKLETKKGVYSIQFSFTTKLFSTLNPNYPVYDQEVARMFNYRTIPIGTAEVKIREYLTRYQQVQATYLQILQEGLLEELFAAFDAKYPGHQLSAVKRLDFIFWSAGKVMAQLKKQENPIQISDPVVPPQEI